MIGTSSECRNESRIHNTVEQWYQYVSRWPLFMTSSTLFSIPIYLNSLRDQEIKEEEKSVITLPSEFILLLHLLRMIDTYVHCTRTQQVGRMFVLGRYLEVEVVSMYLVSGSQNCTSWFSSIIISNRTTLHKSCTKAYIPRRSPLPPVLAQCLSFFLFL